MCSLPMLLACRHECAGWQRAFTTSATCQRPWRVTAPAPAESAPVAQLRVDLQEMYEAAADKFRVFESPALRMLPTMCTSSLRRFGCGICATLNLTFGIALTLMHVLGEMVLCRVFCGDSSCMWWSSSRALRCSAFTWSFHLLLTRIVGVCTLVECASHTGLARLTRQSCPLL